MQYNNMRIDKFSYCTFSSGRVLIMNRDARILIIILYLTLTYNGYLQPTQLLPIYQLARFVFNKDNVISNYKQAIVLSSVRYVHCIFVCLRTRIVVWSQPFVEHDRTIHTVIYIVLWHDAVCCWFHNRRTTQTMLYEAVNSNQLDHG